MRLRMDLDDLYNGIQVEIFEGLGEELISWFLGVVTALKLWWFHGVIYSMNCRVD